MIRSLHISNYALIRDISLDFAPGFNVITGETGAGKSIMLGALGLLQGGRLNNRGAIRLDAPAVISAVFDDPASGKTVTLVREISPNGRSKATIDGQTVNLSELRDTAARLVDIHSQHNNLAIADPQYRLELLDAMADDAPLLAEYRRIYAEYRRALEAYSLSRDEIERTRRDADYLQFQFERLDRVAPRAGEISELEARRAELAGLVGRAEHLSRAAQELNLADSSALPSLDRAIEAIQALREDDSLRAEALPRLEALRIELADIAETVAENADDYHDDPAELDEIDRRLNELNDLLRRHELSDDSELEALHDSLGARLRDLQDAPATLAHLKAEAVKLKKAAMEAADRLSESRAKAAVSLAALIVSKAAPLAMANLACEIRVTPGKLNADGRDTVDWLFSFNKGQELQPVQETASGGEISRIMLALKCITAGKAGLPTVIFDEIDTGVSGDVAARMGRLMADAARDMQVIAITHLPQVAARGMLHLKVYKADEAAGTETHITALSPDRRRDEIALMLSGRQNDAAAFAAADSLLNN